MNISRPFGSRLQIALRGIWKGAKKAPEENCRGVLWSTFFGADTCNEPISVIIVFAVGHQQQQPPKKIETCQQHRGKLAS